MKKLIACVFLIIPALSSAQESVLDVAVSSEMARATKELREPSYPLPYYVAMTAADEDDWDLECDMGALNWSQRFSGRVLTPDVRVGSPALDNHPNPEPMGFIGSWISRDENLFALRHDLWLSLDESYKSAVASFLRKEALRVRDGKREYDTDDLSPEKPTIWKSPFPRVFERTNFHRAMDPLCRNVSSVFRAYPALIEGNVSIERHATASRFYNSDGSRVRSFSDATRIELHAAAISKDGMRLYASRNFVSLSSNSWPSPDKLALEARSMISDIKRLRVAPSTSPFGAPALVDPSIASAIVLSLGLGLTGEAERNPAGAQIFRGKIGKIVFSKDISLEDDPTASVFNGVPLVGGFVYDAEGVLAQKVLLVSHGTLKNLLLSRYPVIGFPRSNGHARAATGYWPQALPSNLFLRARKSSSQNKLMKLLMRAAREEGKPYGLWVRRLRGFAEENSASGEESLRIMPELVYLVNARTGKQTLVRGLDLVGTPLGFLSHVLNEGSDVKSGDHLVNWVPISVITPSLLLSQVELQRSKETPVKPPILPPPFAKRTRAGHSSGKTLGSGLPPPFARQNGSISSMGRCESRVRSTMRDLR